MAEDNMPGRSEFSADEEKAMRAARDAPLPRPDPRPGGAEVRGAYRDLRRTPPVSIAEDMIGGFSESKGRDNALRDAIRNKAFGTIKKYPDVSDPGAAYVKGTYP